MPQVWNFIAIEEKVETYKVEGNEKENQRVGINVNQGPILDRFCPIFGQFINHTISSEKAVDESSQNGSCE